MKKVFVLLSALLFLFACKKDSGEPPVPKAYTYVGLNEIKAHENQMSAEDDINFPPSGSVIFYKTSKDIFGKMRITGIDLVNKTLSFEYVNYNPDGSELLKTSSIQYSYAVDGFGFDFDTGTKTLDTSIMDFRWWHTGVLYLLRPNKNLTKFHLYSE